MMKHSRRNCILLLLPLLCSCEPSGNSSESQTTPSSFDLSIYALNDYHGAVRGGSYYPGIVSAAGVLKALNKEKTILLNSGDMWQGSIESNYNWGELLTKCFKNIGFDAMTIGNHDFDWGDQYLKANEAWFGEKFLGANIYHYDWDNKQALDFASDVASPYKIVERGGFKIGIIGTIGFQQITSISSQFVEDYTFLDPISIIKETSDQLRTKEGCDAILLSHHGSQDELMGKGITSLSPISKARYVDACFCAHTHKNESGQENGVAFVQTNGYGASAARVDLRLEKKNGAVDVSTIRYNTNSSLRNGKDDEVQALVDSFAAISDPAANEVLATTNYDYMSRDLVSNLYARAIYEAAYQVDPTIFLAGGNNARSDIYMANNKLTYGALYEGLPFHNQIVIADVKGSDLIREAPYLYLWRTEIDGGFPKVEAGKTYRVAVLDFVAYHCNEYREYDYYQTLETVQILEKNYRDITADYLRGLGSIKVEDYERYNGTANDWTTLL